MYIVALQFSAQKSLGKLILGARLKCNRQYRFNIAFRTRKDFAEISKNLAIYKSENNFVGSSK